ncbi:MAG: CorA family divalent cation transporter, partial [Pseudoflavonifractor sp.]|nr:CorA family divalent cation transporter [Pseudoflavonifractor sp.]
NMTCFDLDLSAGSSLCIMTTEEFRIAEAYPRHREMLHNLGSVRYCRAEIYQDCVLGILRLPRKSAESAPLATFGFYLTETRLTLIEDSGSLKTLIEKARTRHTGPLSPAQFLLFLFESMVEDDILYLQHLEEKMDSMEDQLLHRPPDRFQETLIGFRRKLSELHAYYEQLSDSGDTLSSDECQSLSSSAASGWQRFTGRAGRLHDYIHLLREYALQLRELYQSQLDARQNKVMTILTVVTTFFLPLTLLTGWYGMNFANMPELGWEYGYGVVIGLALLIIVLEIIYFKRKKIF